MIIPALNNGCCFRPPQIQNFTVLHREKLAEYADFARRDFHRDSLCLLLRKDHPFALAGGKDYSLLRGKNFAVLDDKVIPGYPAQILRISGEIGIPVTVLTTCMFVGPILIQVETGNAVSVFSARDSERCCACHKNLTYIPLK